MDEASTIRNTLRNKRRNISDKKRAQFNQNIGQLITSSTLFTHAQTVAGYLPHDGEADITFVLEAALKLNKHCYLPCINNDKTLTFRRYSGRQNLIKNRFNILEPHPNAASIATEKIDVVLMPLVGFDEYFNRLGMGGGYYDRTFAFCLTKSTHPFLLGCAYSLQQWPLIEHHDWDIPLNGVVTEQSLLVQSK